MPPASDSLALACRWERWWHGAGYNEHGGQLRIMGRALVPDGLSNVAGRWRGVSQPGIEV